MKRRPKFLDGIRYDLYSMLDFGQYDGHTIRWIIENDPEYLSWAMETISGFALTDTAEDALDIALLE